MDFRTCPACQASVLEDDVEDCPFCGASMSGKPKPATPAKPAAGTKKGAAPKEKSKAQPSAGAKKPVASAKKPQRPGSAPAADTQEDDPFEVDTSAVRRAIKLAPRPTKTRTYEVICPMCETSGYMPPEDAGKDVQCCNSECIVPVFKSKRPKIEAVVEEDGSGKKYLIIAASVAAVALIGIVLKMTVFSTPEDPNVVGPVPVPYCQDCPDDPDPKECDDCPPPEPQEISLAQIRTESLNKIANVALDRRDNRNPNVGTQLAAEAFAVSGDVNRAIEQLKRLQTTARSTPHYQVQPLAEIAWAQLKAGDTTAAGASAADGLEKASSLPPRLRRSFDAVTSLAAVLVALGKNEEANKLISSQKAQGPAGTASVIWRVALDSRTYDIELESERPYHVAMDEPLRVGVVETLVAHGYPKQAFAFALEAKDVDQRDAALAGWAGRITELEPDSAIQTVTNQLANQEVTNTGKVRIWCAVASHLASKGLSGPSETAYAKALEFYDNIESPPAAPTPSMKDIYDSQGRPHLGLPNPSPNQTAASACTDVALVALQLGKPEEAQAAVEKAMAQTRAMTPSPAKTQALFDECERSGDSVRYQLDSLLDLGGSSSKIRREFGRYRLQCERLNNVAKERLAFQVQLLRAVARQGLVPEIWTMVQDRSSASDVADQEPYFQTTLPGFLQTRAKLAGNSSLKSEIESAINASRDYQYDLVDLRSTQIQELIAQKKLDAAADQIKQVYQLSKVRENRKQLDPDELDVAILGQIGDAQKQATAEETLVLISDSFDPILKEDAAMLYGGYSVQAGKAPTIWELLKTPLVRDLGALERTAIYRGFLTELARPQTKAPSTSTASNN
ncbi:hypothetical protein KOR42_49850 [Thalassoglobus neptunius]|uniref:Uncharacterized protein n=1 Tax=Thalassoglobus neptunius TaxID=1938619 RepID=A0A5C5VPR4_9PLAN|nr:hypothetical protein [Thalassoglobus neptunius]TWT40137.1 hypothetical protein KOR42_49850 [Thalassoglobus neptunius]